LVGGDHQNGTLWLMNGRRIASEQTVKRQLAEKIKIPIDRKLAIQIKPRIGLCNVMSMMCRRIERQDFETNS